MAEIVKTIRRNPLQTITTFIAVAGVVVGILNFYILANISPLERRVEAIEKRNVAVDPLVTRFIQLEQRDEALVEDIAELKEDMKDLLKVHGLRP